MTMESLKVLKGLLNRVTTNVGDAGTLVASMTTMMLDDRGSSITFKGETEQSDLVMLQLQVFFMSMDWIVLFLLIMYFTTESKAFHKTEHEKLFWLWVGVYGGGRIAFVLKLSIFFTLSLCLGLGPMLMNQFYMAVRDQVVSSTNGTTMNRLRSNMAKNFLRLQAQSGSMEQGSLRGKSFRLIDLVEKLAKVKMRSGIPALLCRIFFWNHYKKMQEEIHDIIQNATRTELNYLLSTISCAKFVLVGK